MALRLPLLLLLLAVASVATPSAVATADPNVQWGLVRVDGGDAAGLGASAPTCDGLVGECVDEDDEPDMEPEDARRFLYRAHGRQKFISYGALSRDRVPCNRRGHSYYNCRRSGRANPYRRGCSVIIAACISTNEIERPCKSAAKASGPAAKPKNVSCRYKKGVWSECDAHTGLKTRTDLLKMSKNAENADLLKESCEPSRIMTRKCKATRLGCKYNRAAAWSDCDARTNLRTKVLKLESGSKQNGDCEPERRITKNCRTVEKPRKRQGETSSADEHEEE